MALPTGIHTRRLTVLAEDQVDFPAGGHVDDVELVPPLEGTEGVADVEAMPIESVDQDGELVAGRVDHQIDVLGRPGLAVEGRGERPGDHVRNSGRIEGPDDLGQKIGQCHRARQRAASRLASSSPCRIRSHS
jgi:hypothetical protein